MAIDNYIVGIGAANVDIYGKSNIKIREHFDHPSIINTTVGGVTRNILENAVKLGINAKMLTAVGDDIYGEFVIKQMTKVGIDAKNVKVAKNERTGIFMQVQDANNDMHLALCDMSISKNINIDYIKKNNNLLKKAKAIVLDPSLDNKVIEYLLDTYNSIPIFVDPISDLYAKKIKPYLNKLYCIKPNKTELANLAGIKIKDDNDLIKAYKKVNKLVPQLYVSLGKDGCLYRNTDGEIVKRSFKPISNMVNASGAGDAFMSTLLFGYINSMEKESNVDYALAAGIVAIQDEHTINPKMSVKLLRKIIKENKR